jgi:hypothetical protein
MTDKIEPEIDPIEELKRRLDTESPDPDPHDDADIEVAGVTAPAAPDIVDESAITATCAATDSAEFAVVNDEVVAAEATDLLTVVARIEIKEEPAAVSFPLAVSKPSGTIPTWELEVPDLAEDGRPIIYIKPGELRHVLRAAEHYLAHTGRHFQRGGSIMAVHTDPATADSSLKDLHPLALMHALDGVSVWKRYDKPGNTWHQVDPSERICNMLAKAGHYEHLPVLNGLARQPYLWPDGSICQGPGHDPATGLFGIFNGDDFSIPTNPTKVQAADALANVHQQLDRAARHRDALPVHLPPDLVDVGCQLLIMRGPLGTQGGVAHAGRVTSVTRRGNLQDLADRLDPVHIPMAVDVGLQLLSRRSSSAWAKDALAVLRMSLARCSSLTSRSRALIRSRSLVLRPSRWPLPTSWRLTHSSKVCGTQPILGAIDSTDANSEGYSERRFRTRRIARSRTSGEKLFDLFMAPPSQKLMPPQFPGRFSNKQRGIVRGVHRAPGALPQDCQGLDTSRMTI